MTIQEVENESDKILRNSILHLISFLVSSVVLIYFFFVSRVEIFTLIASIVFGISSLTAMYNIKANQDKLLDLKSKLLKMKEFK